MVQYNFIHHFLAEIQFPKNDTKNCFSTILHDPFPWPILAEIWQMLEFVKSMGKTLKYYHLWNSLKTFALICLVIKHSHFYSCQEFSHWIFPNINRRTKTTSTQNVYPANSLNLKWWSTCCILSMIVNVMMVKDT